MKQYFHLTIGPVQGFVAQARRSKDLWGGSFLLSWLSAVAIATVRAQGPEHKIMFPQPEEIFMDAVTGKIKQGPKQGGIPNRFKGVTAQVADHFPAAEVVALVKTAWSQLAQLVWQCDLEPFFKQHQEFDRARTKAIWQRQVENIWEISWVLTEDANTSNLLDRRKNWRSFYAEPEPGEKCMVMAGWQELSGAATAGERRQFWQALSRNLRVGKADLEEGELLCALAFIKRRFAHYFKGFQLTSADWKKLLPDTFSLNTPSLSGWSFSIDFAVADDYDPTHVPSLPLLAALPYMKNAYARIQQQPDLKTKFLDFAEKSKQQLKLPGGLVRFQGICSALEQAGLPQWVAHLDGASYFADTLLAGEAYKELRAQDITRRLDAFSHVATLDAASPFYALLLMDGDSLGSQMGDPNKQQGISAALNAFTLEVPELVKQHDGFLIYAGGDDVLALLPMDSAIACARAIERCYAHCFETARGNTGLFSTLSGAIVYAHYRTPLMKIVAESHELLDDIAKEQTGRHALAIRVYKPGGLHAQWSMPWDCLYPAKQTENIVEAACRLFTTKQNVVTNKLLFKLHELFDELNSSELDRDLLTALAKAEYFHSGEQLNLTQNELRDDILHVEQLIGVCEVYQRTASANKHTIVKTTMLQPDGLKLIRFIATKGLEREGSSL